MSKYVFILGAGASRAAGAPLMVDFLDKARALFSADPSVDHGGDFSRVFKAISTLQSVHSKSQLDIVNLESVFSAFEMADLLDIGPSEPGLLRSMRRLISWTLDQTVLFSVQNSKVVGTDSASAEFAKLIADLKQRATVITFNYDLAMDMALMSANLGPDYGLSERRIAPVRLFKLHGSVNWYRCSCDKIFAITPPRLTGAAATAEMCWSKLMMLMGRPEGCCGNADLNADRVIVPPSWDKAEYRSSLSKIWHLAAKELSDATTIVVCGYSLPETDSFFRYLYSLATVGEALLERFWVFDPSENVRDRFRNLLGPGAQARFEWRNWKFEQAIPYLRESLLDNRPLRRVQFADLTG